jgi:hypothetical protein
VVCYPDVDEGCPADAGCLEYASQYYHESDATRGRSRWCRFAAALRECTLAENSVAASSDSMLSEQVAILERSHRCPMYPGVSSPYARRIGASVPCRG